MVGQIVRISPQVSEVLHQDEGAIQIVRGSFLTFDDDADLLGESDRAVIPALVEHVKDELCERNLTPNLTAGKVRGVHIDVEFAVTESVVLWNSHRDWKVSELVVGQREDYRGFRAGRGGPVNVRCCLRARKPAEVKRKKSSRTSRQRETQNCDSLRRRSTRRHLLVAGK